MADAALTAWWDFANQKTLAARQGLGPTLGITRTTDFASYYDSSGVLQNAAAGVARFDHNPSTLVSLGLLVEEARTNICLQSEDFSTTWTVGAGTLAIVGNETVAPDGTTTADKLIDDSSTGTGTPLLTQSVTGSVSTSYAASVFMKADQLDWGKLHLGNFGALSVTQYYDLTNGVVGTPGPNVDDSGIEDVGNGWYRCWLTFTTDGADATGTFQVRVAEADGDQTVDLDGTSSIFVWGAQLEAGAFPTSYIPTVASSVTRNADIVDTTSLGWYNSVEGTLYADYSTFTTVQVRNVFNISDGSVNERVYIEGLSGTSRTGFLANGTTTLTLNHPDNEGLNTSIKCAGAIKVNDAEFYVNGTRTGTGDQTVSMPVGMTTLTVGNRPAAARAVNGHIAEIRYYNTRLTNDQLEDMSNGIFPSEGGAGNTRRLRLRLGVG